MHNATICLRFSTRNFILTAACINILVVVLIKTSESLTVAFAFIVFKITAVKLASTREKSVPTAC